MLKQILKRAGLGFLIGIAVGNVISALTANPDILSPALVARAGSVSAAFLLETFFTGLLGAVSFAGMSFYDIERWSLLLSAVVHYAVIEAVYLPIGVFLGWFKSARAALVWVGLCAAAYLLIFFILWLIYRSQVKELNELQKQYRKKKDPAGQSAPAEE